MIRRFALGTLASLSLSACLAAPSHAITTSSGQSWNYVPDAWTRGNDANTSYFGWDVLSASGVTGIGGGQILDDSTPDLGAIGVPAQRFYQGADGVSSPVTAYGHRSGSGNYYSGFGATDLANDSITGVAPAGGAAGFTTVVLQVIGGAASQMGANAISDLTFTMATAGYAQTKNLYGNTANGTGLYWQEWSAPGANLPFDIKMVSTSSSRSIDAIQVDTFWSPTLTTNAISAIGVPEPAAGLLAILGLAPLAARRRRK